MLFKSAIMTPETRVFFRASAASPDGHTHTPESMRLHSWLSAPVLKKDSDIKTDSRITHCVYCAAGLHQFCENLASPFPFHSRFVTSQNVPQTPNAITTH